MKVVTYFNNFSRGKVDHDLQGRFDIPVYTSGADICYNFHTNFKGNAIYRTGTEILETMADCALVRFNFSPTQNYIMCFEDEKIRFLSYDTNGNFGFVVDGSDNILEVASPYDIDDVHDLQFARRQDVVYIVHPDYAPRKLIRTAANAFTLTTFNIENNPFSQVVANISGITKANPAVVTATAHGLRNNDIVAIASVGGMTELNGRSFEITVINANSFSLKGEDSTAHTTYTSGGTATRAANYPGTVVFYGGGLYYGATNTKPTTLWRSELGNYDNLNIPTTGLVDSDPLQFTIADISQEIEWLYAGDNSLIAGSADGIVAINGSGVNTPITAEAIQAKLTSADGCNDVIPVTKDGFVYYVSNDGRRVLYFQYDLLTESFVSKDANILSYDITSSGIKRLDIKRDRNDLIFALKNDGTFLTANINIPENIIGWHHHDTALSSVKDMIVITDESKSPQIFFLSEFDSNLYLQRQGSYFEIPQVTTFYTDNEENDRIAHNRFSAEIMKNNVYLDNCQTLFYLENNIITYDSNAGTITATDAVFQESDVGRHISYMTITGYESGRFEITGYTSSTVVDVSVLQTPTSDTYQFWYFTFSTVGGLNIYNDTEVSVVADGGYLGDFTVTDNSIDLGIQVSQVWVGHRYLGLVKSFPLGFQVGAQNTQQTAKGVVRAGIRFTSSAGGLFGTSIYKLTPVQQLGQIDINYLPPRLMDGTEFVTIADDIKKDKSFIIAQNVPVPMNVNCVLVEAVYGTDR